MEEKKARHADTPEKEEIRGGKKALVLGGGGSRGFAHLGLIQVLHDSDFEFDLLVGTSMGAVIGGAFCCGLDLAELRKVLSTIDVNKLLNIPSSGEREVEELIGRTFTEHFSPPLWTEEGRKNPAKLSRIYKFFQLFTKDYSINQSSIEYAAVATDLNEGSRVVIKEGKFYKTITASSAIPGVIPPVKLDGRLLIDGGAVDNLPVNVAADLGADEVLAVDVSGGLGEKPANSMEVAVRAGKITARELLRTKTEIGRGRIDGDLLLLRPEVEEINMLNFNRIEEAVEAGEKCMKDNVEAVEELFSE